MTPLAALRIWGACRAIEREERHYQARHARPSQREIRRAIVAQAMPAIAADRAAEADRDLWAVAAAAGVLA